MSNDLRSPFDDHIELKFGEISPDRAEATLDAKDHHHQPFGLVHGGVYCTLVESVASVGANAYSLGRGLGSSVGVSNSTDMLRSHQAGLLRAEGRPIHQGRTQQLWEVLIRRDSDGELVARGQLRLAHIQPRS